MEGGVAKTEVPLEDAPAAHDSLGLQNAPGNRRWARRPVSDKARVQRPSWDFFWSSSSSSEDGGFGTREDCDPGILEEDSDVTTASSASEEGDERDEGHHMVGDDDDEAMKNLSRVKADRIEVFQARTYDRMIVGTALAAVLKRLDAVEDAVADERNMRSQKQRDTEEADAISMLRRQDEDIAGLVAIVYRLIEHLECIELEVNGIKASIETADAIDQRGLGALASKSFIGRSTAAMPAQRDLSADANDRRCVRAIARGERLLHVSPEIYESLLSGRSA